MNITLCDRCEGRDAKPVAFSVTGRINRDIDLCARCHKELMTTLDEFGRPLGKPATDTVKSPDKTDSITSEIDIGYGFCPICGSPGISRERRPNGNDLCRKGHKYLSSSAITKDSLTSQELTSHFGQMRITGFVGPNKIEVIGPPISKDDQ
jgi:hypothetical protein